MNGAFFALTFFDAVLRLVASASLDGESNQAVSGANQHRTARGKRFALNPLAPHRKQPAREELHDDRCDDEGTAALPPATDGGVHETERHGLSRENAGLARLHGIQ